ncbi:uncharacterized protein LOC127284162 isoform X2 [Leptopilina boulardi]|uniref:uncharacterized protein LOC127284162 isoform X2 n=1 Tax=Leptopilina boulardi TaxID=63433 RepID=UPI0021F618CC|nr:uncharacterized protein LOC127284162 isoform X2 [Leptopilina boulardi]
MTGTIILGHLEPQKNFKHLSMESLSKSSDSDNNYQHTWQKMTSASQQGQPIQLTPLWEYVVRTRKFPSNIDMQMTFDEISERLNDPEWEVRQHALRVLIDVLPTLEGDTVDECMKSVIPELVNNLGNSAPAVRKGSLDALRVFLLHSRDRDTMIKNILQEGLNRPNALDNFQTNVTIGVLLSIPLLLFPSKEISRPSNEILKEATHSLLSHLIQITHQEAALKSLIKIREFVGVEEFEFYLQGTDNKIKNDFETLCDIYRIKSNAKDDIRNNLIGRKIYSAQDFKGKLNSLNKETCESGSDTSGIVEEDDEILSSTIPPSRVVLETEIKFNEETAITMTILEEKDQDSDESDENDSEEEHEDCSLEQDFSIEELHKTPRRVHFGGEVVKLRTPDSDDTTLSVKETPKTRIPLPISPATKMPKSNDVKPKSSSQPNSPIHRRFLKPHRSHSSSPRREIYIHNANLSPKKGILTRTNSPTFISDFIDSGRKISAKKNRSDSIEMKRNEIYRQNEGKAFHVCPETNDEENLESKIRLSRRKSVDVSTIKNENSINGESKENIDLDSKNSSPTRESPNRKRSSSFEVFPRQERNYILMELSSPVKHKKKDSPRDDNDDSPFGSVVKPDSEFDLMNKEADVKLVTDEKELPLVEEKLPDELKSDENKIEENVDNLTIGIASGESVSSELKLEKVLPKVPDSNLEAKSDLKNKERNWEELDLVDQEVLQDLHNKDDWRARVRALERIASILRRSSALVAIEPRLGSLLHAVLGGERSCRVAAAGLDVARVVLTGVSEDALKRRLSLIAWGLARQGGPNAAQLARIAMLRLRPALFLEQLMQPQCIGARNAKTRENTLQLLIFSLVTFPSTEFNVKTLTNKVVNMVGDRRRRVRQAALDTLAVLAQIYETEDILQVAKEVVKDRHDRLAIIAAIRARLARKSLPMVSADGLVVYGLQISPTAQITTGADVDWIVAGSGSVSPGTGRTRGQIIATSKVENERIRRNEEAKNSENRWAESANVQAVVSQNEQLPGYRHKSGSRFQKRIRHKEHNNIGETLFSESVINFETDERLEGKCRELCSAPGKINETLIDESVNSEKQDNLNSYRIESKSNNYTPEIDDASEEKFRMSSAPPQEKINLKLESKIPILNSRGNDMKDSFNIQRRKSGNQIHEKSSIMNEKNSNNQFERNSNKLIEHNERKRSGNLYKKRKNLLASSTIQSQVQPLASYTVNYSFDSNYTNYLLPSQVIPTPIKSINNESKHKYLMEKNKTTNDFHTNSEKTTLKTPENLKYSKNDLKLTSFRPQTYEDTYSAIYQRQLRYMEESSVRKLQNRSGTFRKSNFESLGKNNILRNDNLQPKSGQELKASSSQKNTTEQASRLLQNVNKSLDDDKIFPPVTFGPNFNSMYSSSYNSEKTGANEESFIERNRRKLSTPSINYVEHNQEEKTQNQVPSISRAASATSSISNVSIDNNQKINIENNLHDENETSVINKNSRSPSLKILDDKAFDIISEKLNPSRRNSFESFIISDKKSPLPLKDENVDKILSSEDEEEDDEKEDDNESTVKRTENFNESENTSEDDNLMRNMVRTKSASSILSMKNTLTERTSVMTNYALLSSQSLRELNEVTPLNKTFSSNKSNPNFSNRSLIKRNSASSLERIRSPQKKWGSNTIDETDGTVNASYSLKNSSFETLDFRNSHIDGTNSNAIIAMSRSQTPEIFENSTRIVDSSSSENTQSSQKSPQRFISDAMSIKEDTSSTQSTGSEEPTESTRNENNANLHIETTPSGYQLASRKQSTKLSMKSRGNVLRGSRNSDKDKAKIHMQQCFSQLESKDWEITMKGLHTLSQIAKQTPEQLDSYTPGMIVRLLGKHVRNLRSQVSRAACLAAGDIFSLHIRGIDQDLDVLAGPLLNRTADTNKFLRADSNAALDRMVEHLPPNRTIGIIVNHGATHQNAIIRAATARLLCAIVDRIGPDYIMFLPRDVRDKLLSAGAKLLIDGNLNARNHAKEIFRRLIRCEGFKKALSEAVQESTLRHIEKTLRSL